jgi:hypothetical protein
MLMKSMSRSLMTKTAGGFLLAAGVLVSVQLFAPAGMEAAERARWQNLLEGGNLLRHWETTGNWKLDDDGVITLSPRPGESGWSRWSAYLWSKERYQEFEIEFDYKVQARGNSGFYFHVGDRNDPVSEGIEVQIHDSHGKPEGVKLTDHDSGGIIPGLPPTRNTAKTFGYEREHLEASLAMGELSLFPAVRQAARDEPIVANGFSCRAQILEGTGRAAVHVVRLLDAATFR